jgi:hypothetical protein
MIFGIQPIEYFGNINDFTIVKNWEISSGSPATIYFILTKTDGLGTKRFIVDNSTTVNVAFLRSRPAKSGETAKTISKTAMVVSQNDKSLFQINLSADDTTTILSGSVQLIVTISGTQNKSSVPYVVKKNISSPGF